MEATQRSQPPHNIALLPPPSVLGHLIPFIELAKKLTLQHNCTVTLIIPDVLSMNHKIPPSRPPHHNRHRFSPASLDGRSPGESAALVVDLFAIDAIDIAKQFGIPAYLFHVIATYELSLCVILPKLYESCASESRDMAAPITLPGSIALSPEDFPDLINETNSDAHKSVMDWYNKFREADGVIVNSFLELELEAFKDLERRRPGLPPVYPVGPLIRTDTEAESDRGSECVKWLNDQPPKSVLFVSFGSGGTLSVEQFNELALGLDMSGQRFLWCVRSPQDKAADEYLNSQSIVEDPLDFLPERFLERTKGRGLVVASWAPQIQVLSHGSTGGFVTHCGWNSILESTVFGVPLIAWPLCFEQRMNAVFLTEGLKTAIRVKENENGVVGREQISELVKRLMEGKEGNQIRRRLSDVKIAAGKALSREGSSTKALAHVVQQWINTK
ncbi:Hydroquinone glucosyltransferase [Sesamum angolense]|uniref:Hydroquinone glucosyltransferase n=1 Tax=Sesamum angolense TaxID=2727404 RepID=A0AAE1X6S9_9LAMI|nr:Hydroquinone glucosyltransferase [Sesamum angolense]